MLPQICDLTNENAQYNYCANGIPAILFSILFALTFSVHLYQAIIYRKRFCWVICMAAAWETVGFVLRAYSTVDQTSTSTATPAGLLVLLAPLWVNAFDYVVFGRVIWYYLPEQKIAGIRAQKMAVWFVWLDVLAFIIQATGGSLDQGEDAQLIRIALNIYTAGIALQQAFIVGFIGLAIYFHRKMLRGEGNPERGPQWRTIMYGLYGTLGLITLRIIYRLVEFSGGSGNAELIYHESYFYILEATPMFLAMVFWNVFHPGRFLVGPESEFPKKIKLTKQEKKDAKLAKKAEKLAKKEENALAKKTGRKQRSKGDRTTIASDEMPMNNMNVQAPRQARRADRYDEEASY